METPFITGGGEEGGGGGATTMRREEEVESSPPYLRFLLNEGVPPLPRSPPPVIQNIHNNNRVLRIPADLWEDFRSELHPLFEDFVKSDKRNLRFSAWIAKSVVVIEIALTISYLGGVFPYFDVLSRFLFIFSLFVFPVFVSYLFFTSIGYGKLANVTKLQAFCAEKEPNFAGHGWAIECRLQSFQVRKNSSSTCTTSSCVQKGGYFLYFYPTARGRDSATAATATVVSSSLLSPSSVAAVAEYRNGYLRVEIAGERTTGGTRLPSLLHKDDAILPPGMESIPLSDWEGFWSKIDNNSRAFLNCKRKTNWAGCVFIFAYIMPLFFDHDDDSLFTAGKILSIIAFFYYAHQLTNLNVALSSIVNEYAETFGRQGVYMEYCTVTTFHWLCGGYPRRYIYLFPFFSC